MFQPSRASRAFTMIEVAISLAVIGFALVAIIGILPAGLNVQQENLEETIINQEASLWMNAIRTGAKGMDYLTNYVDGIQITSTALDEYGDPLDSPTPETRFYTRDAGDYPLSSGFQIIGLLSWPTYEVDTVETNLVYSNHVVAYVRAVSGAATEKVPQDNRTVRDSAFSYQLTSQVVPLISFYGPWYTYSEFVRQTVGPEGLRDRTLAKNANEIRLHFQWPLRPPYNFEADPPRFPSKVGNSRQSFRSIVGGGIESEVDPINNISNYYLFVQPGRFAKAAED